MTIELSSAEQALLVVALQMWGARIAHERAHMTVPYAHDACGIFTRPQIAALQARLEALPSGGA